MRRPLAMLSRLDRIYWTALAKAKFFLRGQGWPPGLVVLGPIGLGGKGKLQIGSNVTIVNRSRYNRAGINHPTEIAVRPGAIVEIGSRVGISGAAIFCTERIKIGDNVLMGVNCNVYDTDFHAVDHVERRMGKGTCTAPVVIGDDVWLCANVTVLKGVSIGDRSVIAAGSVVTSDIPADSLAGGVPCRVIRPIVPSDRQGHSNTSATA